MALIDAPDAAAFDYGILVEGTDVFVTESGGIPSGRELARIVEAAGTRRIADFFADPEFRFAAAEAAAGPAGLPFVLPRGCALHKIPIREFFSIRTAQEGAVAARAKILLNWRTSVRFCAACGDRLIADASFTARRCPRCGRVHFPRIEPCVIVLVSRGDEVLLARHAQRNQDIFTCLAGFIEAGESAEDAVVREVREEVGISIRNLRYCGSQGWPYPDQLMLAFRAEYAGGEIALQKEEIAEAGWFRRASLPPTARPGSVAYRLIHGDFQ
ncbi:MAG: NAD(+) diphosphatase [Treponemataceae bacterium]|nr:NAD(+) diphosphatase [Treponemataceae bacterium]